MTLQFDFVKHRAIIYRVMLTPKKCTTAILLYCHRTAGVLHTFVVFCLWDPGTLYLNDFYV